MNKDFWNDRAKLGETAGTKDLIAKQLEIEAIAKYVIDGMRILEIGCGNGITAIELARRYDVKITAFDFAPKMIKTAKALLKGICFVDQELKGRVEFYVGDLSKLPDSKFDLIYTERVLINLPDWPTQKQAIINIIELLCEDGLFVMCENSQDGLDEINLFRSKLDLPEIKQPWHDRYFHDDDLETIPNLAGIDCYSSTYYFLSRVVNAYLAEGEPSYDAPINQLALKLPPIGEFGQGKIWLFRKENESSNTDSN